MPKKVTSKPKKQNESLVPIKSICQLDRERVKKLRGYTLNEVSEILDTEKQAVKKRKRVVMRNFLTLTPRLIPKRKWVQ
ncbi:hypothetical protein RI065_01105 [Mycoplasmatota bacterium zrk1]